MKVVEPIPTRVLIEEDLWALEDLANLLTKYVQDQPGDPLQFNDITKAAFLSIAKTLKDKVQDRSHDYSGEGFIIMAKGRRKLSLGFKREPDIYIGSEYGVNFIDACNSYFSASSQRYHFNQRKNTFYGRMLYAMQTKDQCNYDLGIAKAPGDGYYAWFIIKNFTFKLAEVKTRGEAIIGCKMLRKAFKDLLMMEMTKP